MFIKYPYIILGLTPIFVPLLLIFGVVGGMSLIMPSLVDNLEIDTAYDFMNNSTGGSTLFIYPTYTYLANEKNSLADIGTDECNQCERFAIFSNTNVELNEAFDDSFWEPKIISGKGVLLKDRMTSIMYANNWDNPVSDVGGSFYPIGYNFFNMTNDNTVNMDPKILDDFDRIILMRNVYVTDTLRQAVLAHDNVIYLFPDAMTKQVRIENITDARLQEDGTIAIATTTMSLVGEYKPLHNMSPVWADDNRCEDWHFVRVQNGYMMNCTPDVAVINNKEMLLTIRDLDARIIGLIGFLKIFGDSIK